jgi:hypothetical protein
MMMGHKQQFYLAIKRNGQWEQSLQSPNTAYLRETAENWRRLESIDDFEINAFPKGVKV